MIGIWDLMMSEICKTCRKEFDYGIWLSPQFPDEKVLLFCSDKCKKEYITMKLQRIKVNYPAYYKKIMRDPEKNILTSHLMKHKDNNGDKLS